MGRRPRNRRPSPPENIGGILEKVFARRGLKKRIRENRVFNVWNSAVGESIAQNCRPVTVKNGVLTLEAKSSAWLQELSFLGEELKRELNAAMGWEAIKELRFNVADSRESIKRDYAADEPPRRPRRGAPRLSEPDAAEIDKRLEGVDDPELREALRGLMAKGAKREFGGEFGGHHT